MPSGRGGDMSVVTIWAERLKGEMERDGVRVRVWGWVEGCDVGDGDWMQQERNRPMSRHYEYRQNGPIRSPRYFARSKSVALSDVPASPLVCSGATRYQTP